MCQNQDLTTQDHDQELETIIGTQADSSSILQLYNPCFLLVSCNNNNNINSIEKISDVP